MELSLSVLLGVIFVVLFFINWACTLSAQKYRGFRWGDFVLIFIIALVIFFNQGRLKSLGALFPEAAGMITNKPKAKIQQIRSQVQETQETVNNVSGYLQEVAQREMEYQMKLKLSGDTE